MIETLLRSKKLTSIQMIVLSCLILLALFPLTKAGFQLTQKAVPKIDSLAISKKPVIKIDNRSKILRNYLAKYNSPLQDSADDFVKAADANQVDWKLVPSIAGVESTFGKHIPGGYTPGSSSYNGWGWGVYGDQALAFKSWNDAIFTITSALKTKYIDRGLITPYQMNRVYAASPAWGGHVTFFMNDLDKYAKVNGTSVVIEMPSFDVNDKVAGESAVLADAGVKLAFAN